MSTGLGGLIEVGGEAAAAAAVGCPTIELPAGALRGPEQLAEAGLLAVEEGRLLVVAGLGNGHRRTILALGHAGALLPPLGPDERLEALTDSRVTVVPWGALQRLLALPAVAAAIVDALAEGLRERQESLRTCLYVRHSERVREKLVQLARVHGRVVPGGVRIDLPLTQQLLADMVGSARETVSLALAELSHEGFVRRDGHGYRLLVAPQELYDWTRPADSAERAAC